MEYINYYTPWGGQDLKFTYDGLGRRIMVERGTATVSGGEVTGFSVVETRKYVYLGGSVVQELDGTTVVKEYIRGPDLGGGIGGIIYQRIPQVGDDDYYYHYNHKGDVVALTDADGKLAAYYEYDAWGNTMTEAEVSGVDNPYRYSTKEWDENSGLYYFGARYYSPEIGRWTQRDPLGGDDGPNLYLYVGNQATTGVDPWGLQWGPRPPPGPWDWLRWLFGQIGPGRPSLKFLGTYSATVGYLYTEHWEGTREVVAKCLEAARYAVTGKEGPPTWSLHKPVAFGPHLGRTPTCVSCCCTLTPEETWLRNGRKRRTIGKQISETLWERKKPDEYPEERCKRECTQWARDKLVAMGCPNASLKVEGLVFETSSFPLTNR